MAATAHMRVFGRHDDPKPLRLLPEGLTDPYFIEVPGFGALLVHSVKTDELIARLGAPEWHALLVQPDADQEYSERSRRHDVAAVVVDGRVEMELLPSHVGEPRLVVVLEPEVSSPED